MWKWNVRPLQAGRRDRISNIEELCVFGHFHLYFDRQTWTSTHKTQPHTNCGKHLTHSTLFLKGAPHTHTHKQAHAKMWTHIVQTCNLYRMACMCAKLHKRWDGSMRSYMKDGKGPDFHAVTQTDSQRSRAAINRRGEERKRPSVKVTGKDRERERENQYLYLTRREQRKEVQSCSRQELEERGRRAMGLWQGGGSAGQAGGWRDARRGRGGQEWVGMEGERSKGEGKKKHVL